MNKQMKLPGFLTVLGIAALFALVGWMGERDQEHADITNEQVVVTETMAPECGYVPMLELDMPIQLDKVQL